MKVLVTGAAGLLGGNLVRVLIDNGFSVRVMLDPNIDAPDLEELPVERLPGNILDPESTLNALRGSQAVFHCESIRSIKTQRSDLIHAINFQGTRNILVAMSRAGIQTLVHAGSATSFGPGSMDEPGTEENPYIGDRFGIASFESMYRAQELVERFNREGKIRGIIVNPTFMLGPYDPASGPSRTVLEYVSGRPRYYTSGGVNLIGAKEAALGALRALGRGKPGRCYILGGQNLSYQDLFGKIAAALGVPAPGRLAADSLVLARGLAGSICRRSNSDRPAFTLGIARLSTTGMYYSPSRAVSELDLEVRPAEAVIEESCRFFQELPLP